MSATACTLCPVGYSQPNPEFPYCEYTPAGYYNPSNVDNTAGLIAHYSFWGTNRLQDGTGITGPLSVSGSPTYVSDTTGPFSASEYANANPGTGSYFNVPSVDFDPSSLSVCIWFRFAITSQYYPRIWSFSNAVNAVHEFALLKVDTGTTMQLYFSGGNGATGFAYNFANAINTNWRHVCVTKSTSWTVYDNNVAASAGTGDFTRIVRSVNYIGKGSYSGDLVMQGSLDDFRIYKIALTASQVTSLFNFRNVLPCPAGSFQPLAAQDTCVACGPGTNQASSGQASCSTCSDATKIYNTWYGGISCPNANNDANVCSINQLPTTTVSIVPGQATFTIGANTLSFNCPSGTYSPNVNSITGNLLMNNTCTFLGSTSATCTAGKCCAWPSRFDGGTTASGNFAAVADAINTVVFTLGNYVGTYIAIDLVSSQFVDSILVFDRTSAWTDCDREDSLKVYVGDYLSGTAALVQTSNRLYDKTLNNTLCYTGLTADRGYRNPLWISCKTTGRYIYIVAEAKAYMNPQEITVLSAPPCTLCAPGSYSTNAVPTVRCSLCPASTYQSASGASSCTSCASGTYSSALGATSAASCIVVAPSSVSASVAPSVVANDPRYLYYAFTAGTLSFTTTQTLVADILVVGGGGGGGADIGGGGGAGGLVYQKNVSMSAGTYTVTVGAGGATRPATGVGIPNTVNGNDGVASKIVFAGATLTYVGASGTTVSFEGKGGGGGGNYAQSVATAGISGGSGGGGSDNNDATCSPGGSSTQGSTYFNGSANAPGGYAGSSGFCGIDGATYRAGGGGGAGGPGAIPNGGPGLRIDITGLNTWYAAGGGGGTIGHPGGLGGSGIGGNGYKTQAAPYDAVAHAGRANTGSGGGGGSYCNAGDDNSGGAGGSGIVIIRIMSLYNVGCSAGYVDANGTCAACAANTFQNGSICQACPAGSTSAAASAACVCSPGYALANSVCTLCASGTCILSVGSV